MMCQIVQPLLKLGDAIQSVGNLRDFLKLFLNKPRIPGIIFDEQNADNFVVGRFHIVTLLAAPQPSTRNRPDTASLSEIGPDPWACTRSSWHAERRLE